MLISSSSFLLQLLLHALLVSAWFVCCNASASSPTTVTSPVPPPQMPQGNSSDHMALLTFRSSIASDPLGPLSSWNGSSHFCQWHGVTCARRHDADRVIELDLHSLALSGLVHTSIANLTFLESFDLFNNSFHGHIPEEFGHNLLRLRHLDLSMNSLEGEIPPSLGNLSYLQVLDLARNQLTGSIPPQLGSITTMEKICVYKNNLRGSVPHSLGNLTALTVLDLSYNNLTGVIPPSIGKLRNLTSFNAEVNGLTGTVPSSLYNLSSLVVLALGSNQLSGSLPPNFGVSLPSLQNLSMYGNHFYGPIPSSISNASSLLSIQMLANGFSGVIPPTLGTIKNLSYLQLEDNFLEAKHDHDWRFITSLANCTRLAKLILRNNRLEGVLPQAISNLSRGLDTFLLSHNRISGNIPNGIGDLVGLAFLSLRDNLFSGAIPTTIGKLQNIVRLDFSQNQLSGKLPSSICNLPHLNLLLLEMNHLTGAIPPCFGNLQNLWGLDISDNNLSGSIPKELTSIPVLSVLNLFQNSLSGALPLEVDHLKNLNKMDVSNNHFSGVIPNSLGDCQQLANLNIGGNNFIGVIPPSFNKLRGLESLDISRNNLSGNIPNFLQDFSNLNDLNLSFNNFDGETPKGGVFQNASRISILGNPKLCGGILELHLQPCFGGESKSSYGHALLTTIITSLGAVVWIIFAILCIISLRFSKRKTFPSMVRSKEMFSRVTYSQLFRATEGFSLCNLIGTGSFGDVYKGKMDATITNCKSVAVKVINLQQHGASKSFTRECEALKGIRHRNLVKILTSCSSLDFHGNEFKALVLELMQNGSLEQWLHPAPKDDKYCQKHLSLAERVNIATDVAFAIGYLHSHNFKPIVHCDLKPSNVLLDDNMTAHVSDFGLARFLPNKDDSKNPTNSLAFKGSIGYVAPGKST
ncbi:hypothetical protein Taro_046072 [Colocasia esculenta]|uniref:non-specific serine/threonine protein kinase n=1 Tax=Colocasia esculenta TaxID=4460 RepID=A0A843X732_COLES|nr:hypothetical protein [Colocasia esculenta]